MGIESKGVKYPKDTLGIDDISGGAVEWCLLRL